MENNYYQIKESGANITRLLQHLEQIIFVLYLHVEEAIQIYLRMILTIYKN